MHVAVCFWGLLRSLSYCYPSIIEHCFEPILRYGHTYDVFVHTYTIKEPYSNFRNQEKPILLNFSHWNLLNPKYIQSIDQHKFDKSQDYQSYATIGDPWENNLHSLKNHIRALNSLNSLRKMILKVIEQEKTIYDGVIFLRPDMRFLEDLPIKILLQFPNTLFLPDFHRSCAGNEYNDRMAMGDVESALSYARRFESAKTYSNSKMLHSETFTFDYLTSNNISVKEIPFRFARIRTDGSVSERDQDLPSAKQQLSKQREHSKSNFMSSWFNGLTLSLWTSDEHNILCHPHSHVEYYGKHLKP